jgi:hypothetical protein
MIGGSGKAAQGAGLGAALFMGIGGLRGGKMGANGKMQYNPGWESGSMKTLAAHGLASGIVQDRGISTEESSNLWVIHSTVHMYQPHLINMLMTCKSSVG